MRKHMSRSARAGNREGAATASGLVIMEGASPPAARSTFRGVSPHKPDPPLAQGTILGGVHRIDRLLARGGMGAVYLAWDSQLEREVAIKVLLPRHAADPRIAALFHQEAVAMASVRHANVVQVFSAGQHGVLPFFVMEYVPGQTVARLIRDSYRQGLNVSLGTVSDILHQAAEGLSAMRECGLFHGDVKPSNMLIDSSLHVAIGDFGLVGPGREPAAGSEPSPSEPGLHCGTPLYVAPELIAGVAISPEKRHLCDVYSLGVSAFEMLTGRWPFVGGTIRDILRGHLFTAPPKVTDHRSDLPPEIDEVVGRAMEKDPRFRFQRFTDLSAQVDSVAELAA